MATAKSPEDVLIFGCGYVGFRVAKRLLLRGTRVHALTRSKARAGEFAREGLRPVVGDWLRPWTLRGLPPVPVALIAVGRDRSTNVDFYRWYVDGLRAALRSIDPSTRVVYLSSTGVYHQDGGVWVDEYSPCRPKRAGGAAHLAAEAVLRSHRPGGGSTILRLAGIYGPGRLPRIAEIRTGQLLEGADDGFLNLIHADDAAAAAVAALSGPTREPIYVISDGSPVRRRDFYSELGRLAGAPAMLPSGTASDTVRRPRGENSKRVWNRRMRRDLLPRLAYPDYRCGLRQALSLRSMAAAGDQA